MDFKFHPWGLLCYVNNFNDQERILTTGNICSLHIKYALMMQEFRFIFSTTRFIYHTYRIAMDYSTMYGNIWFRTMTKIPFHSSINVKSDITNSPTNIILPRGRLLLHYSCKSSWKYPFPFLLAVNSLYLISPWGN